VYSHPEPWPIAKYSSSSKCRLTTTNFVLCARAIYDPSADAETRYGSIVGLCGIEDVEVATEDTDVGETLVR
jgi:hypothetical protein